MNLQTLPLELLARILAYTDFSTIIKIRRNNYGFNCLIKRLNLGRPVVKSTEIIKVFESTSMESEISARIELRHEESRRRSSCYNQEICRLSSTGEPDMSELYNELFSKIRAARTLSMDEIVVDARLMDAFKRHRIDTSDTALIAIDCILNLSVREASELFLTFKKVLLRNSQLSNNLLCDEIFSVIVAENVKLILYLYDRLQKCPALTDRALETLRRSPNLRHCELNIKQCSTNFTFARIKQIVLDFANMYTYHEARINFGHLPITEKCSVTDGIGELMAHSKLDITHKHDMQYVCIVVSDPNITDKSGCYAISKFRFYIGNEKLQHEQAEYNEQNKQSR